MITVENLHVSAGGFELRNISFQIPAGGYGVLMGRTGSGKTTLLEAICGLRRVQSGRIRIGSRDVTDLPPADRNIGFVPQDAALFSHLRVREQLAFALTVRRWESGKIRARVEELAGWLGLTHLLDRPVTGLSGGETQRVALGRALAFQPGVLCLDEPLSALDQETRDSMCEVLESIQKRTGVTVLHITHNHAESVRLAEWSLVLDAGKLITNPA